MSNDISRIISDSAKKYPDNIALIQARDGKSITYLELEARIDEASSRFRDDGLAPGERVVILCRNSIETVIDILSVSRAGGVIIPIDPKTPGDKVRDIANRTRAVMIIRNKEKTNSMFVPDGDDPFLSRMNDPKNGLSLDSGDDTLSRRALEDVSMIVFTSGTMGMKKGVMLTKENLLVNAQEVADYTGISPDDKVCHILPLYHIYGISLLVTHLLKGSSVVFEGRSIYPNLVLDTFQKYRITGFAGVSSNYAILLNSSDIRERELGDLRYLLQAGDAMPPRITAMIGKILHRAEIYLMYGQTEAGPRISYLRPVKASKKPLSVGSAIDCIQLKIIDTDDIEVAPGEEGEIIVKGRSVMKGYFNDKELTDKTIKGGWLYTGDLGRMDYEGDIYITGRKDRFFKISGNKVNPLEIEIAVKDISGVDDVIIESVPDKFSGSVMKLIVRASAKDPARKKDILNVLNKKFPRYMVPKFIELT